MQYKIVSVEEEHSSFIFEHLERKVNTLIAQGWKPLGGISIIKPYENLYKISVSQAMIKE